MAVSEEGGPVRTGTVLFWSVLGFALAAGLLIALVHAVMCVTSIPLLSEAPVIAPALFEQSLLAYIMYAMIPVTFFVVFRTPFGLRLRATGEVPEAVDTACATTSSPDSWPASTSRWVYSPPLPRT